VAYRERDQALGEVRRLPRTAPALELSLTPAVLLWRRGGPPPRLRAVVGSHLDRAVRAEVELVGGALVAPPLTVELAPGETAARQVELGAAEALAPGRYTLRASARAAGVAGSFDHAVEVVDLPHVAAAPWPRRAEATVSHFQAELPRVGPVVYVRGTADRIPEALGQIGLEVEVVEVAALGERLAGSSAQPPPRVVVLGPRAYEREPALAGAHPPLEAWVRAGGTLLVQYQQYAWSERKLALVPLAIARPHGRVTDEAAPVRVLEPEHRALRHPNPIGAADWEGWVQERGLYFAAELDPSYRALLELADAGGAAQRGALVVAPLGRGTYVYTGLAFFRQLPEGVPGAVRLFLNLLALGEEGA
jgi:hypothetical protein